MDDNLLEPIESRRLRNEAEARRYTAQQAFYGRSLTVDALESSLRQLRTMSQLGTMSPFGNAVIGDGIGLSSQRPQMFTSNNKSKMQSIKDPEVMEIMKERHLQKRERQSIHLPASDFCEGKRGEECKNACALEVKDIVIKYNK